MRIRTLPGLLTTLVLMPTAALAETTEASTDPKAETPGPGAPQSAPDVVKLKDGSLFRGTISERVESDYVEIVLITGKTRRFTMDQVEFAGAASDLPKPASPAGSDKQPAEAVLGAGKAEDKVRPLVTIHGPVARLAVTSAEPGISFHRRSGSAVAGNVSATGYDELCTAPCDVSLPAGSYTLALSRKKDEYLEAEPITVPAGRSNVHGRFESRQGLRTGLLLGGIGAGVLGAYLWATSSEDKEECDEFTGCSTTTEFDGDKFLLGTVALSAGVAMVIFSFQISDKAHVEVRATPGAVSRGKRPTRRDGRSLGALELAGRF